MHRASQARGDLARTAGALRPAMLTQRLAQSQARLDQLWRLAQSLNPDRILERGYARITRRDGTTLTSAAGAKNAGLLTLRFKDGEIDARVERAAGSAKPDVKPDQPGLF
jgi:exodeoxyribonuclease VII large subunit